MLNYLQDFNAANINLEKASIAFTAEGYTNEQRFAKIDEYVLLFPPLFIRLQVPTAINVRNRQNN